MRLRGLLYSMTTGDPACREKGVYIHFLVDCRDQYALESEDPGRRKSVQIMPVDSSPSAAPSHSASAERLQESEELRSNGMRITFKVLHASNARSTSKCLTALIAGALMTSSCMC